MLPQNCSMIHYPLLIKNRGRRNQNEYSDDNNTNNNPRLSLNICCFDYLINLEEYYEDNLLQNSFYAQFIRIIYELNQKNRFDFQNYNKDSLFKFIFILNRACCYYYIQEKIK